jgi:hypothetical protein
MDLKKNLLLENVILTIIKKESKMVDMIIAYLKSNKEEIIDGINKKVNIPLVSEAKEEDISKKK